MTRKDYELIAATIRDTLDGFIKGTDAYEAQRGYAYQLAHDFADKFEAQNSAFDRDRFVRACGFPEGAADV